MAIVIQRGQAPKVQPRKTCMRGELGEAAETMKRLEPGEWFIVPGTAGKDFKKTTYVRCRLKKCASTAGLSGIVIGHTDGDKGVLVKMVDDGTEPTPTKAAPCGGQMVAGMHKLPAASSGLGKAMRKG